MTVGNVFFRGYVMIPCCVRLKEAMNTFSPMEQQVAAFIINYPSDVAGMSIEELARSCNTSVSSVVRLCKSADYGGYKDFLRALSIDLAMDQAREVTYNDISPGDPAESIARNVCASHVASIENTLSVLDMKELEKAVAAIRKADRVDFYGVGTSGFVAMDAHNKFIRIGKISMSSADPHQQILTASLLKKGDAAVLISYSGDTRDMLELADIVKHSLATLVTITRYSKNELSKKADIRLYCSSSELPIRSGAMGSRLSSLTVIDILYTSIASSQYREVKGFLDKTQLESARKHLRLTID
jgi:DNA-binding MurR/RpiR family transcriptional regulator